MLVEVGTAQLVLGDCFQVLQGLPDNTVDSFVGDPPSGIGFMGKDWDCFRRAKNHADACRNSVFGRTSSRSPGPASESREGRLRERENFVDFLTSVMQEAFRVMKPGACGLVWALPRTAHWTAWALEDAGFEVRDTLCHLFGQGFPKSLDIAKAIQKASGVEPIGEKPASLGMANNPQWNALHRQLVMPDLEGEAKKWEGFGTALKPAREDWILIRKPISEKSVAENVLRWGTGGLNIGGARIGSTAEVNGRWPSNVILDDYSAGFLDGQAGPSSVTGKRSTKSREKDVAGTQWGTKNHKSTEYVDSGPVSRFFYVAKPSRKEKEAGCEALPKRGAAELTGREEGSAGLVMQHVDGTEKANPYAGTSGAEPRANFHPTVKSIALMRYFCRLVTPPGGIVLDSFMGSGTTGVAAAAENLQFLGIERDPDYFTIAEARIKHAHGLA